MRETRKKQISLKLIVLGAVGSVIQFYGTIPNEPISDDLLVKVLEDVSNELKLNVFPNRRGCHQTCLNQPKVAPRNCSQVLIPSVFFDMLFH